MSHQKVEKEAVKSQMESLPPPGMASTWCESQYEVIKLDFEWTIQQFAFLQGFENCGSYYSSNFSHQITNGPKWRLQLCDADSDVLIRLDLPFQRQLFSPVRVKIAIANRKRQKIFPQQHCLPEYKNTPYTVFQIEKKILFESDCFLNGKLTVFCEIENLIPKSPAVVSGSHVVATSSTEVQEKKPLNSSDQPVITQLEELFESMKFSDITINVRGRQFQAHKCILGARSTVFAAAFEHSTKESLTNQIEIDDVEPEVFHEFLRFIYTGRVSETAMGKMSTGLLAIANKYLFDQLKIECETQLINQMSVENCLQLLLLTDEHHPAFHLRKYGIEFYCRFSAEVMATDGWERAEQERPELCCSILKELVKSLF